MDKQKVAKELVMIARGLMAASDINLADEMMKVFKAILPKVEKMVKGVKGVEKTSTRDRDRGRDYTLVVEMQGYTRSDLEASGSVYIIFSLGGNKHYVLVDGKRPDWGAGSTKLMEMEFETVVPMSAIQAHVQRLFG